MIDAKEGSVSIFTRGLVALAAVGVMLGVRPLAAQTPFQYREYALETSLASVVKISGTRLLVGNWGVYLRLGLGPKTNLRPHQTTHIQELEWRTPYVRAGSTMADPVRDILFSFYDDRLYKIVVTYARDRMDGLTNDDVMASISATYGVPLLRPMDTGATVVAQWEDATSLLTLTRTFFPVQFQLSLMSKTLHPTALADVWDVLRLAPRRESDQRMADVTERRAVLQEGRVLNKAAFRP